MFLLTRDYDSAVRDLDIAIRISNNYERFYRMRATAYRGKGDRAKADADTKTTQDISRKRLQKEAAAK